MVWPHNPKEFSPMRFMTGTGHPAKRHIRFGLKSKPTRSTSAICLNLFEQIARLARPGKYCFFVFHIFEAAIDSDLELYVDIVSNFLLTLYAVYARSQLHVMCAKISRVRVAFMPMRLVVVKYRSDYKAFH